MSVDYGRDLSCTESIRTTRFATGVRLVAEAAYRRLTTPRGMLRGGEDEQNFGLDLTSLCGSTNPKATAASLPGRIKSELLKDERIEAVDVDILVATTGPATSFTITVSAQTGAGPFTLTLLASSVTVEILGLAS